MDTNTSSTNTQNSPKPKKKIISKVPTKYLIWMAALVLFWPAMFVGYSLVYSVFTSVDATTFENVPQALVEEIQAAGENPTEQEKGALLLDSISIELQRELNSTFGWSVNDVVVMPTRWLDNRSNRQAGVIFSTRMLLRFYATNMAKLGPASPENELLKEIREKRLVYGEDIWGFFRSSSENEYEKAISLMAKYRESMKKGDKNAHFNCRTDDVYNVLKYIISEEFLGHPLGLLIQTNDEVSYFDLDDRIYYTQGTMLVVRDFLYTLIKLYPYILEKGGEENLKIAFRDMDRMCAFDPLIVLRGDRDSLTADHRGKMARYLISVTKRIGDVAESMRR